MKTKDISYFNGTHGLEYELEISDFYFLKDSFKVAKSLNGFDLVSIEDEKFCIHIGTYGIKYDRDISHLKMMIATQRVEINSRILSSCGEQPHDFKKYLPKTKSELSALIDEFKYKPFMTTTEDEVLNFLDNF